MRLNPRLRTRAPTGMGAPMTDSVLDKTFDPAAIEAKWYAHWETNGLFRPERPNLSLIHI